ncbi:helix-turn-helix transcriptional regulator [Modestobacter sp. VKM Ac-2978]|uniref:helix-turn-helix transcriptional regulator n=1 Tax=Modestobacter sp. VKM Ac-2978 TaxID=3004132 RepID=UPI0022AACAD5|nr:helix-turn-helix domain-containing protein [Modestobacter sp. VKM Ac-2978]MCZ2850014.1 helix-turn-helix domain-containing protein [Modestobacter sp. VKM Ac-2978]
MADRLLSAQDVATYLGVPVQTLYQWRVRGIAPRAVKVGRHLRFHRSDLDAWVERHTDQQAGAA